MDSTALRNLFRSQLSDAVEPYLWSDLEIYGYADDAQKMFCRMVGGIADSLPSDLTTITLASGVEWVPTSPLILKFKEAYRVSDGLAVDLVSFEKARDNGFRFDGRTHSSIHMIITGMTANQVRLYPIPDDTAMDTIQLMVERLPLLAITDKGIALEIDEQHHRHLLLWMAHLAYDKPDADTYDKGKSESMAERFTQYCETARREKERAESVPRLMAYGGLSVGSNLGRWGGRYGGRACRY